MDYRHFIHDVGTRIKNRHKAIVEAYTVSRDHRFGSGTTSVRECGFVRKNSGELTRQAFHMFEGSAGSGLTPNFLDVGVDDEELFSRYTQLFPMPYGKIIRWRFRYRRRRLRTRFIVGVSVE